MAQAQECVLLKAITDAKTPSLLARIAAQVCLYICVCLSVCACLPARIYLCVCSLTDLQVSEYCDVAFTAIQIIAPTKKHPWVTWPSVIQAKALYYRGLAHYYLSVAALRDEKYGEQV